MSGYGTDQETSVTASTAMTRRGVRRVKGMNTQKEGSEDKVRRIGDNCRLLGKSRMECRWALTLANALNLILHFIWPNWPKVNSKIQYVFRQVEKQQLCLVYRLLLFEEHINITAFGINLVSFRCCSNSNDVSSLDWWVVLKHAAEVFLVYGPKKSDPKWSNLEEWAIQTEGILFKSVTFSEGYWLLIQQIMLCNITSSK